MILALLIALAQERVQIIDRLDLQRAVYEKSAYACEDALKLIDRDPEEAVQRLNEIHDRLDQPDKPGLTKFEMNIRIEQGSGDYTRPLAFFPFQVRARAKMKLAERARGVEEKRKLLAEAVADLRKSVDAKAASSEPFLKEARELLAKLPAPPPPVRVPTPEEIAASWSKEWAALRPRLAYEGFQPGQAGLAEQAGKALRRMAAEAAPRDQVDVASWIAAETEGAKAKAKALSRDGARRAIAWCDAMTGAIGDLDAFRAPRQALAQTRADAARIAEYRGSFTLKIGPSPWAGEVRVLREGKEVAVASRSTPVVLTDLEIGEFTVELSHPDSGARKVDIPAASLREGKTYVLSGRMKGELSVTPLP